MDVHHSCGQHSDAHLLDSPAKTVIAVTEDGRRFPAYAFREKRGHTKTIDD
jgi:hypothetical protein